MSAAYPTPSRLEFGQRPDGSRYDATNAGRFEMEIGDGYPLEIKFYIDDTTEVTLHHRDFADLSYVLGRAKDIAREKLGPRFREV